MIRIVPPLDPGPLLAAARAADRFDWIIFTSANGVERFWSALAEVGRDTRSLAGVSICAIGSATAAAVTDRGAVVDLVPPRYVAESVIEAFRETGGMAGLRALLPRAEAARDVIPTALRALDMEVSEVVAYRTIADDSAKDELSRRLRRGEVDYVTFTSSSAVRHFARVAGAELGPGAIASIGPITSATVHELGWDVTVEARVHTIAGLVSAIVEHAGNG